MNNKGIELVNKALNRGKRLELGDEVVIKYNGSYYAGFIRDIRDCITSIGVEVLHDYSTIGGYFHNLGGMIDDSYGVYVHSDRVKYF